MKVILNQNMNLQGRKKQILELKIHQKLKHPNIVNCVDIYINQDDQLCIKLEKCQKTLLDRV